MVAREAEKYNLVLTRVFDAPREVVFAAWTDEKRVARWWGPHGYTCPRCEWDARPGGTIRIDMRGPDGTMTPPMKGVIVEMIAPERLVFTAVVMDERGESIFEISNTVTFAEESGKTRMTFRANVISATPESEHYLPGMKQGWTESLERLDDDVFGDLVLTLPSEREIVISRVVDAPRELVFKAYTTPEMIAKWWGRRRHTTVVDKMELHPGGAWRYVQLDASGNEVVAFNGVYREIVPPERIVFTFEYEGQPGHVVLNTTTFEERGSKTRIVAHSLFQGKEDRDGMLDAGMRIGANEAWDQLAELLRSLT